MNKNCGMTGIVSTCFNDKEAKKFIAEFKVDKRLEGMCIEIAFLFRLEVLKVYF